MASDHQHQTPSKVTITKTISVYPNALNPPKVLNLSNLDRQCPMHMYLVFFYKPSLGFQNLPASSVFGDLKTGLEKTLSFWYPAAGRLRLNPNDGKLEIWCNNGGAVLAEAVTRVKISELGDLSHYNEFFENLVFKPSVGDRDMSESPLVVAQVTKFGCGGYSVGVGTSHSLFDGPAAYDFLCAWAHHSNNMKEGENIELQKPLHERERLVLVSSNYQSSKESSSINVCKNSIINPKIIIRVAAIDHLYQLIQQVGPSDQTNENCVLKTFHLSGEMIEKLKRKVFREGFSSSSFEVLAVHLWKVRTKALGLNKQRTVCLQFAVDIRNKMVPPLPKVFTGNAYVLVSIALTAQELEVESHEAIVEKIREAKNSVTNDYVNAYIEALEGPQATTLPPLKELTMVSDWTRLPFHRVGFMGKEAAYASPLVPPVPQVAYFMQSPSEAKGIDVRIGLIQQSLDDFSSHFLMDLQ